MGEQEMPAGKRPQTPAPDALKPPPGNPRFPLFDGLRAAAALGVLVGHCAGVSLVAGTLAGRFFGDMQLGVTIFFVISGFLLYRPYVAADMAGTKAAPTRIFYRRRILRIFPAYWFALTLTGLLPGVVGVLGSGDWWHYYLLIQNYMGLQEVFARGIVPAWSLSVEVAFYLVLPLFAMLMRRGVGTDPGQRVARDLTVLATIAAISAIIRVPIVDYLDHSGGYASQLLWTAPLTLPLFLTWFAFGMCFASVSAWSKETGKVPGALRALAARPGILWLAALALYAGMVLTTPALTTGEWPYDHIWQALIAAAVVFPAAFPHPEGRGLPARVLSIPSVAWLGLISYGLFLWADPLKRMFEHFGFNHTIAPLLTITAATLACAIVAGAISYYLVERPFLRLKTTRDRVSAPPKPVPQRAS
jgi:peptidoglycan/LPS O-acetylase OafA/YrhL